MHPTRATLTARRLPRPGNCAATCGMGRGTRPGDLGRGNRRGGA